MGDAVIDRGKTDLASHDGRDDLIAGLSAVRVWGTLGWHDIRQRYRRSVLGPFWFTLSTAIMVVVLGALYSELLHQDIHEYLPYLAIGLVVWGFISSVANEACSAFIGAGYLIKQIRIPLTVHICRIVWRNFVILLHSLPVVVALIVFLGRSPSIEFLLVPLALFLLFMQGVWLSVVLGVLCTRFRDIQPIVANLIQVAFFFTPVMWSPEVLKSRAWVAQYNPLYHLIELVRAPLMGRPLQWESWAWSIGMLVVGFAFAHLLMRRTRNRVPYWL
ncbi:ABC transporter permease [Paraburkholderia acidiphila]|uniref:Transport permease protein n=1 Tax=Paraburkholderia acidiphila TaxID=2571747 RepID=A0A7Z2J850_9BURK|nr:ABC transporter permease [Paraburkholderia acidiphila]QGZ54009.1 ABC transporter permease [Paraburkholderia acidiphila]